MAGPAESLAQSNTVEAAEALAGMQHGRARQQRQAPPVGPAAGPAGAPAAAPNGGGNEGGGSEGQQQQQQHLRELALEPKNDHRLSEQARTIARNMDKLVPNFLRKHPPGGDRKHHTEEEVRRYLGELASQFQAGQLCWETTCKVLEASLPEGTSLAGCFVPGEDERQFSVDVAGLHAAGCYPHTWTFPLKLAEVQEANAEALAIYNQGPEGREGLLQDALGQGGSRRGKRPAEAAEAPGAKQPRGCAQMPESSGGQRARSSGGAEAAAAEEEEETALQKLQRRIAPVQERRFALVLQAFEAAAAGGGDKQRSILELVCAIGHGSQQLQGVLGCWGQLTGEQQMLVFEAAREAAFAQPPTWERLDGNLGRMLSREGVVLPPGPGGGPAAAAPAAAAPEPTMSLQRVRETLVHALDWDPEQPGPANDPWLTPFVYLSCLEASLQQGARLAAEIDGSWGKFSEARRRWLVEELALVAADGAWPQLGLRLQQALTVPVDVPVHVPRPSRDPRSRP